ncbi:hypothetical protein SUGI_0753970 [Cryptomeria japonica]|nr:hypothetical protein SUGI_0753970 [Cryptomeria japonica]
MAEVKPSETPPRRQGIQGKQDEDYEILPIPHLRLVTEIKTAGAEQKPLRAFIYYYLTLESEVNRKESPASYRPSIEAAQNLKNTNKKELFNVNTRAACDDVLRFHVGLALSNVQSFKMCKFSVSAIIICF